MTANSAQTAKLLTTCFAAAFFSQAASASVVNSFGFLTQPDSRGLIGNANNSTRNVLVSSAPAPGGITYLSITGGLTVINTASYAREACIEITCPSGRKYIAQPFATQSWSGTQAIPANTVVNFTQSEGTGVYQLRFFEQYQDSATGADAVWDNFQIAFHDGAAADVSPVNALLDPTAEGPLVTVLAPFIVKANQTTADFIFNSPSSTAAADRVRIRGYVTTKNGWVANTSLAPSQYLRLNITAPNIIDGSPFTFTVAPFPTGGTSSGQFDLTLPLPQRASCGTGQTWRVSGTTVATGTSLATGTDLLEVVMSVQQLEIPRPTVEADLGVMRSRPTLGPVVSTPTDAVTTTLGSGQVKWYTFTTEQPLTNASGYWLDIHTQIPAGSPINDHWLALYEKREPGKPWTPPRTSHWQTRP